MVLTSLFLLPARLLGQVEWFRDDFQEARLKPTWNAATGIWNLQDHILVNTTTEYDHLLASSYHVFDTAPYSLEAQLRGPRAGLFFGLDDTTSKRFSQMVRFDDQSILSGYFNGAGDFIATGLFDVPRAPGEWTTLRIDVDPQKKLCRILVNGRTIGTNDRLVFPAGFVGLQGSEGRSEFRSVRITGDMPPRPPVQPRRGSVVRFSHVKFVRAGRDNGQWTHTTGTDDGTRNTVALHGLLPLKRYTYRISPTLQTLPPGSSQSREYRFSTPPADPGMMPFARLPLLCMVYRTICYRDRYPKANYPSVPDGRTLAHDEILSLRQACDFNREFYFRNSSCRLVLDFDFYVVEDTLWLHEVGDQDPYWLSPNERVTRDFEKAARALGKQPEAYAGLVCPCAWLNHPPRRVSALTDPSRADTINIRQAYGGGTLGVPAPWRYGKTSGYTSNPFQDRFSRQDWLITHEFHHQLDALLEASGYPEYYHADQPWKMPGRFGEDFDFNAHIVRNAHTDWWLTMKFGRLNETRDEDRDGVPDDDPTLPTDERRLHGNSRSMDTDADRLTDLREVMAGTSRGTALENRDTDGDGLTDSADPEPLYTVQPVIRQLRQGDNLNNNPFTVMSDPQARLFWAWDSSALYVGYEASAPLNLLFQIDAESDGWFHGFDNIQIRASNTGDSARVVDYYLRDCSSWLEPPRDRKDILLTQDLLLTAFTYPDTNGPPGSSSRRAKTSDQRVCLSPGWPRHRRC